MKEGRDIDAITKAINDMRKTPEAYIDFLGHFGPALKGVVKWKKQRSDETVDDLLTVSDEAFLALCCINYGQKWKAEGEKGETEDGEDIPVRQLHLVGIRCVTLMEKTNIVLRCCRIQNTQC